MTVELCPQRHVGTAPGTGGLDSCLQGFEAWGSSLSLVAKTWQDQR